LEVAVALEVAVVEAVVLVAPISASALQHVSIEVRPNELVELAELVRVELVGPVVGLPLLLY
jgi:hypothetical protein